MSEEKNEFPPFDEDTSSVAEEKKEPAADGFGDFSEEELSMLKASIESADIDRSKLPPHDTSDKATFFRQVRKNKLFAACALFVAISLILGAIGGSAFLALSLYNSVKPFQITIGTPNEEEPYAVPYKDAVIDGVLYVDMHKIADFTGMSVSGTESRVQFASKSGSYLRFEDESSRVQMNGAFTDIIAENYITGKKVVAPAFVNKNECLIPVSFLARAVDTDTMRVQLDKRARTLYIRPRYTALASDPDNKLMKDIIFTTENFTMTLPETEPPVFEYTYGIDVKDYLKYIKTENLLLANKNNPVGRDYSPGTLVELTCPVATGRTFQLEENAAMALYAMMLDMEAAGIADTYVTSAYRSYTYQETLYNNYITKEMNRYGISREEAIKIVDTYSARPGQSEHQTGLCFDLTTKQMGGAVDERFERQPAFEWLQENAHKYGFILRYPKSEEKIALTGYDYEPWHYRFVGRQAASEMNLYDQCLEEYLAMKNA